MRPILGSLPTQEGNNTKSCLQNNVLLGKRRLLFDIRNCLGARALAGKNCFLVICWSSLRKVKQEESAIFYSTIRNLRKIKRKLFNVLQILCVCRCKRFLVAWICKARMRT